MCASVRSTRSVAAAEDRSGELVVQAGANDVLLEADIVHEWRRSGVEAAKIEYLYVDLGSFDAGAAPFVTHVNFKENIVRAGLNYKFSGPIFSRY